MKLSCRHCRGEFRERGIPIVGISKEARLAVLMQQAGKHMQTLHPHLWKLNDQVGKIGFLELMMHVDTDDADLIRQRNLACAEFVRAFGRPITDEDIRKAVDKARQQEGGMPMTDLPVNTVIRIMKELRDVLTYADMIEPDPPSPAAEMPRAA